MAENYSNKNLQNTLFQDADLSFANFSGSDLRGANFTGANLTGANLTNVRTGLTPPKVIVIFIIAFAVSLLSGYIAAQVGHLIKTMLGNPEQKVKMVGYATIAIILLFLFYTLMKGGNKALNHLVIPAVIASVVLVLITRLSGIGTGRALLYQILAFVLAIIMVYIGTIARAAAGGLSNILFTVVALAGGMFGKSIAGGIGPVIFAVFCALISKKALSGAKGFDKLKNVAFYMTERLGTSFRNTKLANADFSQAKLHNADFTGADITPVNWGDSKKFICKHGDQILTDKKKKKHD